MIVFIQPASPEELMIMDIYSDIDTADLTVSSGEHYSNISIDSDLISGGKVLVSRRQTIEEISPEMTVTKVISWNRVKPEEGYYQTRINLSRNGGLLETKYYNFSYGHGFQETPKIFIKGLVSDSMGLSVVLTPLIPQIGTEQEPVLADIEYMLVDGDTVIFRTTDRRVTVDQTKSLSKDWFIRLENNHKYSARIKVTISSIKDFVIARSRDFVTMDDASITELFRDETGASVTVEGKSQVPFRGSVMFTVLRNGEIVEKIIEKSPILMSGDDDNDETIEVTWSKRLMPGVYELTVELVGNDGDILDRRDTVIDVEQKIYDDIISTPVPEETPGFNIFYAAFSIMVTYLLSGLSCRR